MYSVADADRYRPPGYRKFYLAATLRYGQENVVTSQSTATKHTLPKSQNELIFSRSLLFITQLTEWLFSGSVE